MTSSNGNILQALCGENPPVTGVFPSKKTVTQGFDVFFDLRLNKRLGKQLRRRWFEAPPTYDVTVMWTVYMYGTWVYGISWSLWLEFYVPILLNMCNPRSQSSWGQHGAHLGPVGPRWALCWPHEPCYHGCCWIFLTASWNKRLGSNVKWRVVCVREVGIIRFRVTGFKNEITVILAFHVQTKVVVHIENYNLVFFIWIYSSGSGYTVISLYHWSILFTWAQSKAPLRGFTWIPACIINHTNYKVWNEITYIRLDSISHFNGV